jgi:II/X family phage/plasmid replication protein
VLLNAYPLLSKFFDFDNLFISSLDITYFSRAKTQAEAQLFIDAIGTTSRGQTKSRTGYKGATAYFGSARSKLKKLKVYAKYLEVMDFYNKLQTSLKSIDEQKSIIPFHKIKDFNLLKIYTQDLIDFTLGMIRWEATIKSDWLRERGYSLQFNTFKNEFDPHKIWQESFKDLFFLLESKTMIINDYSEDNIRQQLRDTFVTYDRHGKPRYTSADNAFKTFILIKERGFSNALEMYTVNTLTRGKQINKTWYNHLTMFRKIGLTDIYLQGFRDGEDSTAKVVPLIIFSKVDFDAQFPHFYKAA